MHKTKLNKNQIKGGFFMKDYSKMSLIELEKEREELLTRYNCLISNNMKDTYEFKEVQNNIIKVNCEITNIAYGLRE